MSRRRRTGLTVTMLLLLASGCASTPSSPYASSGAVDDSEAIVLARRFEQAILDRSAPALRSLVDADALLHRICNQRDLSRADRAACLETMGGTYDFANTMLQMIGAKGTARLLALEDVGGAPRPLLRVIDDHGDLHYLMLHVDRAEDGRPVIVDAGAPWEEDPASASLRRIWAAVLAPDAERRLARDPRLRMEQAMLFGQFEAALTEWPAVSAADRRVQSVRIAHLICTAEAAPDQLLPALAAYRRDRPDDPAGDHAALKYLMWREQWPEALEVIANLRSAVGDDAFLDTLEAQVHLDTGDLYGAALAAATAVELEPTLVEAWWTRLEIAVAGDEHDQIAACLASLNHIGEQIPEVERNEDFAKFVGSPAYRHWVEARERHTLPD